MERDTFVLEEALLLHESWIYARPDGWHEKKVSVLKGFCLFPMRLHIKGRFLVQKLTSSNVISEFVSLTKPTDVSVTAAISKTAVPIFPESR